MNVEIRQTMDAPGMAYVYNSTLTMAMSNRLESMLLPPFRRLRRSVQVVDVLTETEELSYKPGSHP